MVYALLMTERGYHHGNLRTALLQNAEELLREDGADALSLREVARRAGVSHGAPRAHFIDRQSLLNALAVRGFERLADAVREALEEGASFEDRFRLVARAYVRFAVDDAALMEVMFMVKTGDPQGIVHEAAAQLFQLLDDAIDPGSTDSSDVRERFKLVFAATVQGTAALIATQRVTPEQGQRIVEDAANVLLESNLGAQAVPGLRTR
jgi:AcrR family transcriptional regulator